MLKYKHIVCLYSSYATCLICMQRLLQMGRIFFLCNKGKIDKVNANFREELVC